MFSEPPDDTNEFKLNDFKRGKGRFNQRDYTMDNKAMINTFSHNNMNVIKHQSLPIVNRNSISISDDTNEYRINDFERGKGRFNQRDFTTSNALMINTFSHNNMNAI